MSLQFYIGASGSGKSYKLHRDITEWAQREPDRNFLYLVPDQATMQTQIDLVKASARNGIMNVDVLSFSRLCHRVFEELGCNDLQVLDDTGKSLILRQLSEHLKEDMPILGHNLNKIGYIHEIKSIISEFKQYDIDQDKLNKIMSVASKRGMLNAKLKDIAIIYNAFNQYISEEFITSEETLTLLANRVSDSRIIRDSVVVFDGFTGFTPVQYRLIQCLLGLTKRVIVSITMDADENPFKAKPEQHLFYLSSKTIADLQKKAIEINVTEEEPVYLTDAPRFIASPQLYHLERHIFRTPIDVYRQTERKDDNGENDAIKIIEAATVEDEVRRVCIEIKKLVLDGGYQYRNIAVTCGDLAGYADEFVKLGAEYNIPIYIDQTHALILNPFVEFLRSALNIIRDDYSYDAVFHFLRCGLVDLSDDEIDRLDNYIVKCGIRGKKAWEQGFTRPPYKLSAGEEDSEYIDELNRLNQSREKIICSLKPLMVKKATVTEFIENIYSFIIENDIESKISEYEEFFRTNNMPEKAKEYSQVYRLVIDLLDQMHGLLKGDMIGIEEFIDIFDSGIEELDVGTIPGGVDRVIVGDIERSRIGQIKVLFFTGVNDGNIPKANSKGGIISDTDREFLKDAISEFGLELSPTPREQIFSQRLYLYMNMTKPSDRLYISYSRATASGKSMKESYLVSIVRKMFPDMPKESAVDNHGLTDRVLGYDDSVRLVASALREYAVQAPMTNLTYEELVDLFKVISGNENIRDNIIKILDSAFFEYKEQVLSKSLAKALYGDDMRNSVSRLERYYSCSYAHFLQYGLRLYERDEFGFKNNDLGNIYHHVLERFAKDIMSKGYSLADYPDEIAGDILDSILLDEGVNYGDAVLHSNAANAYRISQIRRIIEKALKTTREQLKAGDFVPDNFEMGFKEEIKLPDGARMTLHGQIDRMDLCQDGDRIYVKIMDYKSGSKDIELDSLLYGLQLQHPLYMMAAMKAIKRRYPELNPQMAAMLYFHIDDPISLVEHDTGEDESQLASLKALKPTGLVNSDKDILKRLDRETKEAKYKSNAIPVETKQDGSLTATSKVIDNDDYELITRYVSKVVEDAATGIVDGNVAINPKMHNQKDSCEYCAYKDICAFDSKLNGYAKKQLKKLKSEEAMAAIKEKLEG